MLETLLGARRRRGPVQTVPLVTERPVSDCRRIAADGLLVGRCHRFRGSLSLRWRGIRQNGSEIGRKKDDLPYVLLFCDSLLVKQLTIP